VLRQFFTPRWWGVHALTVLAALVMYRIGLWQWHKGRAEGDWLNYGYAAQWWLFVAFAVGMWVKLVLDELQPGRVVEREARTERRDREAEELSATIASASAAAPVEDEDDEELAAYNRHLAWLHENARR